MSAPTSARRDDDYVIFCEGVRRLCQVDLLQYKRPQMERRLRTFAERKGQRRLEDYLATLKADGAALEEFLDRMTINVSQLWRNPEQWRVLERTILPELAETGRIRAWSAGSSYGAEAYTLAALCRMAGGNARTEIHGTDIDARMVARARDGRFSREDARTAPADLMRRFFEPLGEREGDRLGAAWRARPELRSIVRFEVGDLLRMRVRREAHDLVLCRNTVIYFNQDVRDALHARLAESLRPGGYLMIGSTERVTSPRELGLAPAHPFTYRKS